MTKHKYQKYDKYDRRYANMNMKKEKYIDKDGHTDGKNEERRNIQEIWQLVHQILM